MEFAYGSDPRSAASTPDQSSLPSGEFAAPVSTATEGAGVHQVAPVVTGNPLTLSGNGLTAPASFGVTTIRRTGAGGRDVGVKVNSQTGATYRV